MSFAFLQDFVLILAAAVLIIFVSHRIKLPPVVGFLVTGILIGPGGFSLIRDSEAIDTLAEIGVVMLLFLIGLEFTFDRLKRIQRYFWLGGGLQVIATIALAALLFGLAGISVKEAFFFGFLVSLSSTAVVLKSLADRGETDSPQGRIALGILIFQDLAIVPMIALVPVLSDARSGSLAAVLGRFLLSTAAIAAVFIVGRTVLPRLLHAVVATRIREIFLITSVFLCLGTACSRPLLGLSLALGAFLAGVIISESEYSHQVVSDILPFKDVFNSLFFISIGMLLHTDVLWRSGLTVAELVLAILFVKITVVFLTVRFLGYGGRIALIAALSLAQIGEFSFVLAGVGRTNGLLPENAFQIFLASSILTLLLTPLLIRVAPGLALRGERAFGWKRRPSDADQAARSGRANHVIVAGFGLNGRNLAHVLQEAGIGYVILDLNPETYRRAVEAREPIIFGDVSSPTILREAGIATARGIVFAISDPATTRRGVKAARALGNEDLFIIVRTRYASEIDELYRLGAERRHPRGVRDLDRDLHPRPGEIPHPAEHHRRPDQGPARRMLRHPARNVRAHQADRGADRRLPLGRDGRDVLHHPGLLAVGEDAQGHAAADEDRGDRHRRRPGGRFVHQPGGRFPDRGRGHPRPGRQPPRHGPGLRLPGNGRGRQFRQLSAKGLPRSEHWEGDPASGGTAEVPVSEGQSRSHPSRDIPPLLRRVRGPRPGRGTPLPAADARPRRFLPRRPEPSGRADLRLPDRVLVRGDLDPGHDRRGVADRRPGLSGSSARRRS